MPRKFHPEIITANKNKLWLVGRDDSGGMKLLQRNEHGQYTTIAFNKAKEPIIAACNIINNDISLIIGDGATIIGVTHKYFKSTDLGKTWSQEKMPSQLYADPIAFWGRDKVWTYSGAGSIQLRR